MPAARAGRAAVEVIGEVANFGANLERDLNNELREVDVDMTPVADSMRDGIRDGVKKSGKEFDGLSEQARRGLKGVGDEADRAGERIGAGIGKGTNQARDELGRFIKVNERTFMGISLKWGSLPKILGAIGKASGLALGGALGAAALASTVNTVFAITTAIGPAVGAVGPLAAAFIGAKIAAGTFQLALMGVGDALSAGLTGDTAKFNEALEQMPVTAQTALKELVGLKKEILGVREVVQGNFFGQLIGQIQPLGALYLPLVANQLGRISTGFGKAAKDSAAFLRTPDAVRAVNASLTDTGTAVNNVTAGLPGLIRAFLPLWEVGSSLLPGLTSGFSDLTQRAGAFLENARASGQLATFFQNGLTVLGQLGAVLKNIGSILFSVFQAASAAGGDFLGVIGQTLEKVADFLNTAEGMAALEQVFAVLAQVGGLFGQALSVVLPVLGQLVGVLAGALAPVLPVISNLIASLAPVLSLVGQIIGTVLAPVITTLGGLLQTLIPVIMPIATALGGVLLSAAQALAPILATLGQVIGAVLTAALTALQPLFAALVPVMQQIAVQVLPSLLPLIVSLGDLLLALMPIIQPLIGLLVALIQNSLQQFVTVMPPVLAAINWLVQALTSLIGPIAQAIGWVLKFITSIVSVIPSGNKVTSHWNNLKAIASAVFRFIGQMVTVQINIVKAVLNSIGGVISRVIGFFARARSTIISAVGSARAAVSSAVSGIISALGRLASGAASAVGRMIGVLRGIGGKIRGAVGNLAGLLVNAGRNVINGLISGITQRLGALRSAAGKAAGTIRNLFPFSPAKEGPLSGRGSPEIAGRKIATMIAAGLQARIPAIKTAAFRAAETARLSSSPVDTIGRGILSSAMGSAVSKARLTANLAPLQRPVSIGSGAIMMNFYGPVPTEAQAERVGAAAGRGLASAMQTRNVATTMRTI